MQAIARGLRHSLWQGEPEGPRVVALQTAETVLIMRQTCPEQG
jgi:hypothetical protein